MSKLIDADYLKEKLILDRRTGNINCGTMCIIYEIIDESIPKEVCKSEEEILYLQNSPEFGYHD